MPRQKGSSSSSKTKSLRNRMPGARVPGLHAYDDQYIKKLMKILNLEEDRRPEAMQKHGLIELEAQEDLEILRYAFTLLRFEYGDIDLAKINPYVVLSCAREALADRITPYAGRAMLNAFKDYLHLRHVRDQHALDLLIEEEQKHRAAIERLRSKVKNDGPSTL